MIAKFIAALLLSLSLLGVAGAAPVHPAYLELQELAAGDFRVLWKQPLSGATELSVKPVFPDRCVTRTLPTLQPHVTASVDHWVIRCGKQSLYGDQIGVDRFPVHGGEALLKLSLSTGMVYQQVLRPDAPLFRVPERPNPVVRSLSYLLLGAEAVIFSFEHLLFLAGLMLLTRSPKSLWQTLIGFTVGYCAVLSTAVLEAILLPQVLISALIALSILFVAAELRKRYQRKPESPETPWLIATVFGGVHGFAFATVLAADPIPTVDIPIALLFFSIGVQAGPLLLLTPLILVKQLIRFHSQRIQRWEMGVPAYGMGALAALWFIESTVSF